MEAKDIIMKAITEARKEKPGIILPAEDIYNAIFKAGRDSFLDDVGNATIPLSEAHKAGRREVVEWIRKQPTAREGLNVYLIPEYELKDWEG